LVVFFFFYRSLCWLHPQAFQGFNGGSGAVKKVRKPAEPRTEKAILNCADTTKKKGKKKQKVVELYRFRIKKISDGTSKR
jgi:hypothetical protein